MLECNVVTQDKKIFQGEVESIVVPGSNGEMGILESHAPLITLLSQGKLVLTIDKNTKESYQIEGGIAEVLFNKVSILTDRAEKIDN